MRIKDLPGPSRWFWMLHQIGGVEFELGPSLDNLGMMPIEILVHAALADAAHENK